MVEDAGRGGDPADIEAALDNMEASLAGVNFTNIALETLDENIFERALTAIEKDFAAQPLVKSRLLQTVADTLEELGLLDRATKPQEEALRIRRETLGDDHPDTLESINNMGGLLQEQGKLSEAEPYYREALRIRRETLGDDHSDTLISINNMGALLFRQGKMSEAEPYYREALEGFEKQFGSDDWRVGNARLGLGRVWTGLNRFAEAEPALLEAERALGTGQGAPLGQHKESLEAIVTLYESWHAAEPGKGYDAQAAEWRGKLAGMEQSQSR